MPLTCAHITYLLRFDHIHINTFALYSCMHFIIRASLLTNVSVFAKYLESVPKKVQL